MQIYNIFQQLAIFRLLNIGRKKIKTRLQTRFVG